MRSSPPQVRNWLADTQAMAIEDRDYMRDKHRRASSGGNGGKSSRDWKRILRLGALIGAVTAGLWFLRS